MYKLLSHILLDFRFAIGDAEVCQNC